MIKIERKILVIWFLTIVAVRLSLLLPHRYLGGIQQINTWIQILLTIILLLLAHKSKGSERGIYINLSVLFGFVIFKFFSSFIGYNLFIDKPNISFYYHFYINFIGDAFICIFTMLYLVIDYSFRKNKLIIKYLITSLSTISLIILLFLPYIFSPSNLKKEKEYSLYQKVHMVWTEQTNLLGRIPTNSEILEAISKLPDNTKTEYNSIRERINTWRDYIKSEAGTTLFWQPVAKIMTYTDFIMCITVIILLSMIYILDKPYYAYMDKVLFLILLIFSLEILHDWMASQISGLEEFRLIYITSQYFTVFLFLFLVYVFHLKLRFVLSPVGSYYGEKLLTQPEQVTRWKDEIDILILKTFTKKTHSTRSVASINNPRG